MRLIDADSLVRNIKKWEKYIGNYEKEIPYNEDIYVSIMMTIEDEPTVDAVPVRHGHYVGEADGYANGELVYDVWKCSECGCVFEDDYEKPTYNYCPNCGADMRGEEECAKS